jgi:monolysocardiolipin acyltransferase
VWPGVCRAFFQSGKVLPVIRGAGLDQPSLSVMARRLGTRNDWLHIFPEGRISYDGKLSELRWGIGKMVCETMKHTAGRYALWLVRGSGLACGGQ